MANDVKDATKFIADQDPVNMLAWYIQVDTGTVFRHKETKEHLVVVHTDFTGANCRDKYGERHHYPIHRLVKDYEIVKTEMAEVLYKDGKKEEPSKT